MQYKKGENVYINFMDGVMIVEILNIIRNRYEIEVKGKKFLMKEEEVSKIAKVLKGSVSIKRASNGAEE